MAEGGAAYLYSELGLKEKEIIYEVLDRYKFKVIDILKAKKEYKIITNNGTINLRKIKSGRRKIRNAYNIIEQLRRNGFDNIGSFVRTRDGELFIKKRKSIFYAIEEIEGEECNFYDIDEVIKCVELLANFHVSSNRIDMGEVRLKNKYENWPQVFNSSILELEKFKKIIEKKRIKNEFDACFYNNIDTFYNIALISISLLNKSDYYKVIKNTKDSNSICYDGFDYKNIIKKNKKYYLTNIDNLVIDVQINDLGRLIRKLMYKASYQWDFTKAKLLIETYNKINKIDKAQLQIMLAFIIFPYKFCKLGRKRYVKHKNWSEEKYTFKLNKLIKYNDLIQKFVEDYIDFLETF